MPGSSICRNSGITNKCDAFDLPDTGIALLGSFAEASRVVLFGLGANIVSGAGKFWQTAYFRQSQILIFRAVISANYSSET